MSSLFRHAAFETSVASPHALPKATGTRGPEIAFAGRSNAGKSSAINTLVGHNRLAFVSKTPGRTQLINRFRLRNGAALVDLPGYGYAAVPHAVQEQWQGLLEYYLTQHASLIGLVLVMDARRPLTKLDRQMLQWFMPTGKPIHGLLTKADKLTRNEQARILKEVRSAGLPMTFQLFSSLEKTGIEEAEEIVGRWIPKPIEEVSP